MCTEFSFKLIGLTWNQFCDIFMSTPDGECISHPKTMIKDIFVYTIRHVRSRLTSGAILMPVSLLTIPVRKQLHLLQNIKEKSKYVLPSSENNLLFNQLPAT